MKKRMTWLLALICLMGFTVTACRNGENSTVPEAEVDQTEKDEDRTEEDADQQKEQEEMSNLSDEDGSVSEKHIGVHPLHLMTGRSYENYWSEIYNKNMVNITYPTVKLEECCSSQYPELAQTLENLSQNRKEALMGEYESMIEQAAVQLQEVGDDAFQTYESSEEAGIQRADSNVVSILMNGYYYGGGVHGMPYQTGYTYDVKTGQELQLTDVVSDLGMFAQLVQDQLAINYEPETFYEDLDLQIYLADAWENITWVLGYQGLTVIFNPYEIAPYAAGTLTATIPFTEYPDIVKTEYQQVPDSYAVQLTTYDSYFYDVDGDGMLDELSVFGVVSNEYDSIVKHAIQIDDRRFEVETDSYRMEPVLIHMEDGQNYLYIQDVFDNDYCCITIYRFTSDGAVEYVGQMDNCGWYSTSVEEMDYVYFEHILTDPNQFRLDSRTDVFSTLMGYKDYQISANGMPAAEKIWFTHSRSLYLTLKQSLDVDVIDENTGETTGTMILEAGTEVLYYRTDNETFADLKLEDGVVVRVLVNVETWPRTVNGLDAEAIFDGMMFAG